MIPKVIHYCWFGKNKLPKLAKKCIKSWKKYCPDFKIVKWDEDNFDISKAPEYVKEAYSAKKWAFVTDYVRLWIIYNQGGIYFDTDVELIKSIDHLLTLDAFFGFEDFVLDNKVFIATGLGFGSIQKNRLIQLMMDDYFDIHFLLENGEYDYTPCPQRNSHILEENGFKLNGKYQIINNVALFPSDYFCPINWKTKAITITDNTISVHHFAASWMGNKAISFLKRTLRKFLGNKIYERFKKIIKK